MSQLEDKAKEVHSLISQSETPLMFFDMDCDGTTSYLQLKKVFPKIQGYPLAKDEERQEELLQRLKHEKEWDLIIVYDLGYLPEFFFEFFKDKKMIWADHHLTNDANLIEKYNVVHLNPLNYDAQDNRPSSYLAYLVSQSKENLPLASFGTVADFHLLPLLKECYELFPEKFKVLFPKLSEKKREELFTFLEKYSFKEKESEEERAHWIRYLSYDAGLMNLKGFIDNMYRLDTDEDVYRALKKIETISLEEFAFELEAAKSFPFEEYAEIKEQYQKRLKRALKKEWRDVIYYEYKGKKGFSKPLSEELMYRYPQAHIVIIAYKKQGSEHYRCSMRSRSRDVNALAQKAVKGLRGKGGGHKLAAGSMIHRDDYDEFKRRIFEELGIN
jgi:single-stranded DNA-specific DHH superfamily exonuclease